MNRAVRIGVALVLAVHVVLGCYLHHAHPYGGLADTEGFAVETACPCHHGSGASDRTGDYPSQRHECHGVRCVFTRSDSLERPNVSIGHGCLNAVCVAPAGYALSGIDEADSSGSGLGPQIPLHLLHQVLLI